MPLIVENFGESNEIDICDVSSAALNGRIVLRGSRNKIFMDQGCRAHNLNVDLGGGCSLAIASKCDLGNLFVYARNDATIIVGAQSCFNGWVRLMLHEPGRLEIGDECLFAGDVDVTVSDMHSIIDVATGLRINPARDVKIGKRVWVGQRALLLKGATVGENSVIGAASVVAGSIPASVIAAGNPAQIKRVGVRWRPELV